MIHIKHYVISKKKNYKADDHQQKSARKSNFKRKKESTDEDEDLKPKQNKKNDENKIPTLRTRTAPTALYSAISILNAKREKVLIDMGSGGFIGMKIHDLPGFLGYYVISKFDDEEMKLPTSNGAIEVTEDKVHEILGIPNGGMSIDSLEERNQNDPFIKEWFQQFPSGKKDIRPNDITDVIVGSNDYGKLFRMNFLMLFANTMGMCEAQEACSMNILKRINDNVIERVEKFKKGISSNAFMEEGDACDDVDDLAENDTSKNSDEGQTDSDPGTSKEKDFPDKEMDDTIEKNQNNTSVVQENKDVSKNEEHVERNENSSENRQMDEQQTVEVVETAENEEAVTSVETAEKQTVGEQDSVISQCEDEVGVDIVGNSLGDTVEKENKPVEQANVSPIQVSALNVPQDANEVHCNTCIEDANEKTEAVEIIHDSNENKEAAPEVECPNSIKGVETAENKEVLDIVRNAEKTKEEDKQEEVVVEVPEFTVKDVRQEDKDEVTIENIASSSSKIQSDVDATTSKEDDSKKTKAETEEFLDSSITVKDSSKEAEES
ncbi:hypothetical protein CTI12_AA519140 [Artemisia annua]|uniref:Uncharacterized protein n=1 Tax=Artemisia annua TaxID=35608 RepID=A0A2U1L503_ARTAN|nr:hypothetical protein CTI12_AA519140 [Artemisia annua]